MGQQIYVGIAERESATKNKIKFSNSRIGVVYVPKDMIPEGSDMSRIRVTWELLADGEEG